MSVFRFLSMICYLSNVLFTLLVSPLLNLIWEFGVGLAANTLAKDRTDPKGKEELFSFSEPGSGDSTLSITVVGASGDLAKKKIFPALFALYYEDCLPKVLVFLSYLSTLTYNFTRKVAK